MTRTNVVTLHAEPVQPRPDTRRQREDATIRRALSILSNRMRQPGELLARPSAVREYMRLYAGELEHEIFMVLFLDAKNCLIAREEMFRGALTEARIYPREVVKAALHHNAANVILAHNHPSGKPEPSEADMVITNHLKSALDLIEVRVLDHIIVTASASCSMAERGLL
jgi:DNA repair protein RadC